MADDNLTDLWAEAEKPKVKPYVYSGFTGNEAFMFGDPDRILPREKWAPRGRPTRVSSKNSRAAVALPHGGQSYHPTDEEHQRAIGVAVNSLSRKQEQDKRYMDKMLMRGQHGLNMDEFGGKAAVLGKGPRGGGGGGAARKRAGGGASSSSTSKSAQTSDSAKFTSERFNFNDSDDEDDDDDDDDEEDSDNANGELPLSAQQSKRTAIKRSKEIKESIRLKHELKARKRKKLSKAEKREQLRSSRAHRRMPDQRRVNDDIDNLDEVMAEVGDKLYRSHKRSEHRRRVKSEDQSTIAFGRHHHQPMALEVAPTTALTGSLRQMLDRPAAGAVAHPLVDRIKSLEERNMIAARMRHKYNQKREVIMPGQVHIKKETFGLLPE